MPDAKKPSTPRIIPTLHYRDGAAAIEWLCTALGFERHLVVPGAEGAIPHAQLTLAGNMIMVSSEQGGDYGRLLVEPAKVGGVTQAPYIVVEEIDAHYARAVAAGAEIAIEIADQDYGGRFYACRDPEGHVWNFGSYDPWAEA